MLKWIASGCLVIVLVVCVVVYAGYRKMSAIAASGPSVTVGIKGTPQRVYASLTSVDSLSTWISPGMTFQTSRKGSLGTGDTLLLTSRRDSQPRSAWVIDTVVPNTLVAMRLVILQGGMVVYRRRDSIAVSGDSTLVTSTVVSAMMDSLTAANGAKGGVTGGLIGMASTMGNAGARMQAEQELKRLKLRIEGPPVSRP
jgi:hypothetical protein